MQSITNTRRFRLKILGCMLDPVWMAKYGELMRPEYFEAEDESVVATGLLEHWRQYRRPPSEADDLIALIGPDYKNISMSVYMAATEWDLSLAKEVTITFARQQAARIAVLESLPDVNEGNLEVVVERLRKVAMLGSDIDNLSIDLVQDVDEWLYESVSSKVPTGILHLDAATGGGLSIGELGVFMAPTNHGKSMALINVGVAAAGPISRLPVLHFSFEMGKDVVAKRYASRLTFRFPGNRNVREYRSDFLEASSLLSAPVRIEQISGTVERLRGRIDYHITRGYKPGVIIIDHGDEVAPGRRYENIWLERGDVFKGLRQIAIDYKVPVWTATQSGRQSLNKEVISVSDISESIRKADVADAIIAICQTAEEEPQEQCRLYVAKLRDGASGSMVRCKYIKESQAIISTGYA